jgi:hypothetical protein
MLWLLNLSTVLVYYCTTLFVSVDERSMQKMSYVCIPSLFCFACSKTQNRAPQHSHEASKGDLPVLINDAKQKHLCGNPKQKVSSPATQKL